MGPSGHMAVTRGHVRRTTAQTGGALGAGWGGPTAPTGPRGQGCGALSTKRSLPSTPCVPYALPRGMGLAVSSEKLLSPELKSGVSGKPHPGPSKNFLDGS